MQTVIIIKSTTHGVIHRTATAHKLFTYTANVTAVRLSSDFRRGTEKKLLWAEACDVRALNFKTFKMRNSM